MVEIVKATHISLNHYCQLLPCNVALTIF